MTLAVDKTLNTNKQKQLSPLQSQSDRQTDNGLPEELYFAMLDMGYCAKRHKIPAPLARTMIYIAEEFLDL